jgi:hypothetical protein
LFFSVLRPHTAKFEPWKLQTNKGKFISKNFSFLQDFLFNRIVIAKVL